MRGRPLVIVLAAAALLAMSGAVGAIVAIVSGGGSSSARLSASASASKNPALDPGTPLSKPAPDFTLTDESGHRVSLRSFRGKVVILAFNDPVCTTVCPLTTTAMVEAKALLGPAASRVQLLGVTANPTTTSLKWTRAYSKAHRMVQQWRFLTGSLHKLKQIWRAYGIEARVARGEIDHTPALYVINQRGWLTRVYLTQMAYASVDQLGRELAENASRLLPGHPPLRANTPYKEVPLIDPGTPVSLPRAGGGTVHLGPSSSPHLILFFDTWDSEVTNLAAQLQTLNRYQAVAARGRLPSLIAVDEGSVEPSRSVLPRLLRALRHPLSYPVAIDRSGRVADGYRVQDEPWLELISPSGEFLWYHDVSTGGWPRLETLIKEVHSTLARAPKAVVGGAAQRQLADSPAALASLHQQAGRLLESDLTARLRALRGHPIVINAWASWCAPCQAEFSLFASASLRYGRKVAFLGADSNDSAGDARAFLRQHPVSYPSYQTTTTALSALAAVEGLPTTIFVSSSGRVVDVHTGQYTSQSALDGDITHFALGR